MPAPDGVTQEAGSAVYFTACTAWPLLTVSWAFEQETSPWQVVPLSFQLLLSPPLSKSAQPSCCFLGAICITQGFPAAQMAQVGVPHFTPLCCWRAEDKENVVPPSLTHVGPEVASKPQLAVGDGPAVEQETQVLLDIAKTKQDDRGGIIQVCRCVQQLWLLQHSGTTRGGSPSQMCCGAAAHPPTPRTLSEACIILFWLVRAALP